ncbi:hypothetical protein [Desulfosporosinus fructosivorans]
MINDQWVSLVGVPTIGSSETSLPQAITEFVLHGKADRIALCGTLNQ